MFGKKLVILNILLILLCLIGAIIIKRVDTILTNLRIDQNRNLSLILNYYQDYERLSGFALDYYCSNSIENYYSAKTNMLMVDHSHFSRLIKDIINSKNPHKKMSEFVENRWPDIRINNLSKLNNNIKLINSKISFQEKIKSYLEYSILVSLLALLVFNFGKLFTWKEGVFNDN